MKEICSIKLTIGDEVHQIKSEDVTPETSLNSYLREKLYLTGTKRMCLEGGCGVCIVAAEETMPNGGKRVFAINSCLVSIMSCHGWKIHTTEGIGNSLKGYHAIQKLLAENNGTQCGYCSPGMVMNMYSLHESGPKTKKEIENSFGGNICRCTGYRPIMESFFQLASLSDIEDIASVYYHCKVQETESFSLTLADKARWTKVYYLKDILETFRTSGDVKYILVAGNTAKGVFWRKTFPQLYIDITSVNELTDFTLSTNSLTLGANVSLTKAMEIFKDAAKKYPNFEYLNNVVAHIDLIANVPVRNIGTIAGNLMIKHEHPRFQSDMFVILETIEAVLVIVDTEDNEFMKSPSEFLTFDMKKKLIRNVILKEHNAESHYYRSYKIMNRSQNTHATVNAGFLFKMSTEGVIKSANIVYGAITTNFSHALLTEALLKGLPLFDNNTLQRAFTTLSQELNPDVNPPDPGPECRKQLAINLFYKCILSLAPEGKLSPRNKSGASLLLRPLSSGVQEFSTDKTEYPVTEPIVKLEALAQTSGEAQYIGDKPDLPNQLHACFVTAETIPGSVIVSIQADEALKLDGTVAFFSSKDIPGINSIIPLSFGLSPAELFCSEKVQFFSQPIGVIVATTHEIAMEASKLIKIKYELPKDKPLLTPQAILAANRTDKIIHNTSVVPKKTLPSSKTVTNNFYIGSQYHFHMETHCCYVIPSEGELEIHSATQWIAFTQCAVSQILNLDAQKIDIIVKRVGGGYGGKVINSNYVSGATALAAMKLQRPVRMWLPFHLNMKIMGKRYPHYAKYSVGVDQKGIIQNMTSELYCDYGMGMPDPFIMGPLMECWENCYKTDTWSYDTYFAKTDTHPNTFCRAPGTLEGVSCIESLMDDIAYSLNLNPLDVRLGNLDKDKHPKLVEFIQEMKTREKFDERWLEVEQFNKANRWKKRGLSITLMKYPLSVLGNYTTLVSIYFQNGGVAISHGGIEVGQGINTKVTQVCAWKLGIPLSLISIKPTTNLTSPNSFGTAGSWTSEAICYTVILACEELLRRMQPIKEKNPGATWDQLVKLCYGANINLSSQGYAFSDQKAIKDYLIYGACAAEVELDVLTGQIIISRVNIIEDVGNAINPLIDIGQVEGAFVMGTGYYLNEQLVLSPDGEVLTNRTWNYTPPGVKDIPVNFQVRFPSNNPNPDGILKSKATAEPPVCLSVAVPLAIRHALASARMDSDSTKNKWVPINGPTTVEYILLNSLNNYKQFTL
ncbi:hypothetical protein ABEB36_001248 [Hypothenemus hampei]|uniref:FAD-binding PCMH-type domain-containing protein n=1 Tax=Hypothenemus hampei TaxID=57062 RepID=A0ABD1FHI1_HYPHA